MSSLLTIRALDASKAAATAAWNFLPAQLPIAGRVSSLWANSDRSFATFCTPFRDTLTVPISCGSPKSNLEITATGNYSTRFQHYSSILKDGKLSNKEQAKLLNERAICNLLQKGPFEAGRADRSKGDFLKAAALNPENTGIYLANANTAEGIKNKTFSLQEVSRISSEDGLPTSLIVRLTRVSK